ncbi:MAG TPA: hypothetical protein VMM17_07475, partial [Gemmatimonadaceae bacterium]|nr:hypothetical protein [Gemmatimonadaceae bacterium]
QLEQLSRSRVVGAAITRRAPSAASADSLAQDWISRLGTPSGCFLYHYRDVSNEVAVFQEAGRTVYITKRPPSRGTHSGGTLELPSAVQLLIAAPDSRAVPKAPRSEQVDCPLLFASARNEPARPKR